MCKKGSGEVPHFCCCLFLWSDFFQFPAWLVPHPSTPYNHYLFRAHMNTSSLQGKLTLEANNIKPHTMRNLKLYSYTSHYMAEEGKRSHILALDPCEMMLPLVTRKGLFSLCHLSVTPGTAVYISSFLGHDPKNQVHMHNVHLQLQHLPPPFSCRTRFHILPPPLRVPRKSREKWEWGTLVYVGHDLILF